MSRPKLAVSRRRPFVGWAIAVAWALALAGAIAAACNHDVCTQASDHADECVGPLDAGSTDTNSGSGGGAPVAVSVTCADVTECEADCQVKAHCDALTGKNQKLLEAYLNCRASCLK